MKKLSIYLRKFYSSKIYKILAFAASLIPALAALGIALYYIWGPGPGYFHSDCTDSLLWANASVESGKVFDESFRYAALLPFSGVLWFIPLIKIFGLGMTAQNIGMSLFALLFCAAIWFFCRSAGFGRGWSSSAVFFVTLTLCSSDKLREIMLGHTIYYSVSLLILFTVGGFFMQALRSFEKKNKITVGYIIFALLAALMCLGTATDGGQVIIIGSLPVIAGLIAERLFDGRDKLFCRRNIAVITLVALAVLGTGAGILMLAKWKGDSIDASYANAYSGWSDIGSWAGNAQNFFKQYLSLLGVATNDGSLFSMESVTVLIRLVIGLVIIAAPFVMLALYRHLRSRGTKIMLWAHFVVTAAIMTGFICGKLSGANWRLTPIVGTAAMTSFMGLHELCVYGLEKMKENSAAAQAKAFTDKENTAEAPAGDSEKTSGATAAAADGKAAGRVCLRFGVIMLAAVILLPLIVFNEIRKMPADYGRDNYKFALAEFLVEKDLKYGYATFWYSQAITVLSDSKTQCREVLATRNGGVYTDFYQSSRKWYVNQNHENYYVLLSDSEYASICNTGSWKTWIENYLIESYDSEDGVYEGFVIYVFSVNILDLE